MSKEAMKLALEALENAQANVGEWWPEAITALREALASQGEALAEQLAQQQEPVAWGVDWGKAGDIPCVSIIKRLSDGGIEVVAVEYAPYSYTSSPASKPLTDDEIERIYDRYGGNMMNCTRAIERAHGIKENT